MFAADKDNSTVTDILYIHALLRRLQKNNCSLNISAITKSEEMKPVGLSEILNIDIDNNAILFDAINNSTLQIGQKIKIITKYKGIEIKFTSIITELTTRNHATYFNCAIPSTMIHKQRRQQYRAELQNLWKIPVTIVEKSEKNSMTAYIYNISTGGINIRSSTASFNTIKKDSIVNTVIQLPNTTLMQCKLRVRKILENNTAGFQQLAGQFLNLDAQQEKNIQAFVNKVERSLIKNREKLSTL